MSKIIINYNPTNNGRVYPEELFLKYVKEYEIKKLKIQRIEKIKQLNNYEK